MTKFFSESPLCLGSGKHFCDAVTFLASCVAAGARPCRSAVCGMAAGSGAARCRRERHPGTTEEPLGWAGAVSLTRAERLKSLWNGLWLSLVPGQVRLLLCAPKNSALACMGERGRGDVRLCVAVTWALW